MRTIKLVIIGESGCGKTSLRTQYIAGRFSTGYRATIGADFFAKTLQHHSHPEELISLQIWDTAGQERFSSLSKAFFRGADAVLLVFDVNQPSTLHSLRKWWITFCETAPVPDDEAYKFCTVFVGNKTDLVSTTQAAGKPVVSEADTQTFINDLIPAPDLPHVPPRAPPDDPYTNGNGEINEYPTLVDQSRSSSIDILINPNGNVRRAPTGSRATSRSRFAGTMNTVRTGISIYHTPSSSFFDSFASAPSSPPSPFDSPQIHHRKRPSQSSLSSTLTVTPLRPGAEHSDPNGSAAFPMEEAPPYSDDEPDAGPKVFFTSAKTSENVGDVFAYVARRVVAQWEWDETHIRDSLIFSEPESEDTIRLGGSRRQWTSCC